MLSVMNANNSPTYDASSDADTSSIADSNASSDFNGPQDFDGLDGTMIDHENFYEVKQPFDLAGYTFEELPEASRKFLIKTALCPFEFADRDAFFQTLLEVRRERRDKFARTIEGVNRAIVAEMISSNAEKESDVPTGHSQALLSGVLYPEWQEHLDEYVDEIDALIWLDMSMRLGCEEKLSFEGYMMERMEDVKAMVEFAMQRLQITHDKIKQEKQAEWVMRNVMVMNGAQAQEDEEFDGPKGHISDEASDVGDDAQWITVAAQN